jgi:c-di-GMP-binding flagellar brake protein YcgR
MTLPPQTAQRSLLENYDRRRYRRYPLSLAGRYMLEDRREYVCRTIDVSADGAALAAPIHGHVGERVIAYIDNLGRLEGAIVRVTDIGFTMTIAATLRKRDKLAASLAWLADRDGTGRDDARQHGRIAPRNPFSTLTLPDGTAFRCRILDLSLSGAAIAVDAEPPVGAPVRLGTLPARIGRHFAGGLAVEFKRPQTEAGLEALF